MTEILGHDVNGEALRAGDRVRIAYIGNPVYESLLGEHRNIVGPATDCPGEIEFDEPAPPECRKTYLCAMPEHLRRINSGRDAFNQARDRALTEGNPDGQRTEPTTTERAQAWISGQPRTEPSR